MPEYPYGPPPTDDELANDYRGKMVAAGERIVAAATAYDVMHKDVYLSWDWPAPTSRRYCAAYRAWRESAEAGEEADEPYSEHQVKFEERQAGAEAWSRSTRIQTLDQLLDACDADLGLWQVERWVANKWEVGTKRPDGSVRVEPLYQVKAWFKRRMDAPVETAIEGLIERLAASAPHYPHVEPLSASGDHLLVPNLYDAHFNKRSADGLYTPAQAARDFMAAADGIVARVLALGLPVGRIMLPAGHDALHADNLAGTTTKGTWVELAADQRDAVDALIDAYAYLIERLAEIAPVDVVVIESNHDRFASYWLGKVLEARFGNHPHVTVDATRSPRKYYRWGKVLIGMEHGDKTKPGALALLMANEAPDLWAGTTYREWLRGHLHHSAGLYRPIADESGVSIRVIPALCPPDEYHLLHGFVGGHRAAEALYYSAQNGPAGAFPVFVDELG